MNLWSRLWSKCQDTIPPQRKHQKLIIFFPEVFVHLDQLVGGCSAALLHSWALLCSTLMHRRVQIIKIIYLDTLTLSSENEMKNLLNSGAVSTNKWFWSVQNIQLAASYF